MAKALDTMSDLRSALAGWITVSGLVALACFVASALVPITWLSLLSSSVGSAGVSVFAALLITEYVIKPLYTRDIISVARLSAEVHDAGLVSINRLHSTDLSDVLSGRELDISGVSSAVDRIWPNVIESALSAKSSVRLTLPSSTDATKAREYEQSWKESRCETSGASLQLLLAADSYPLLTVVTDSRCIVAVGDGMGSSGNPLVMVFTRARSEPYVNALVRQVLALRDSEVPPNYVTERKSGNGRSNAHR